VPEYIRRIAAGHNTAARKINGHSNVFPGILEEPETGRADRPSGAGALRKNRSPSAGASAWLPTKGARC
jgi:hypothetical protein